MIAAFLSAALWAETKPVALGPAVVAAQKAWAACLDRQADAMRRQKVHPDRIIIGAARNCEGRREAYRAQLRQDHEARRPEYLASDPAFDVDKDVARFETRWLGLIGFRLDAAVAEQED